MKIIKYLIVKLRVATRVYEYLNASYHSRKTVIFILTVNGKGDFGRKVKHLSPTFYALNSFPSNWRADFFPRPSLQRDIEVANRFVCSKLCFCFPDDEKLETFCGSPPYAAPELFLDQRYDGRPVDVWSLGVLLFFMTTATMPFLGDNMAGLRRSILAGQVDTPPWMSQFLKSLIGK